MTDAAPWLSLYTAGAAHRPDPMATMPGMFADAVAAGPERPAIHYFDRTISYGELDRMSSAFAAALLADGFAPGDRLAIMLQNMPQFLIAMLAAWKAGGVAVTINPMNREREVSVILGDAQVHTVVVLDALDPLVRGVCANLDGRAPRIVVVGARAMQARNDPRVIPPSAEGFAADTFEALLEGSSDMPVALPKAAPGDLAMLVYTSGTTGVPKAAMLSHANLAGNAAVIRDWYGLGEIEGPILGMAPLFHVTGLVGHVALAFARAAPLVLTWRFEAASMRDALVEFRPVFTIGTITAYVALMNLPGVTRADFASFHAVLSGGAAVPPALVDEFRALTGLYLHNGYGLTETSAGVIAVPYGREAPVDPASGTLAVGVPTNRATVWIAGEEGERLPVGEAGEIVISSPAVASAYWRRPEDTAEAMRPDGFRTGDVGFMDDAGWVYLVDRKKDMINASGFKVWPREVEDVLYGHPAIREAAVVGVSAPYRGETVRAVISLRERAEIDSRQLQEWCRERMAAYKVPREVLVLDELPKTPTGKILRRELRDHPSAPAR